MKRRSERKGVGFPMMHLSFLCKSVRQTVNAIISGAIAIYAIVAV